MKYLNFGSLNMDHVYRVHHAVEPGETAFALSHEVFCGGKGLNQSVAAARAGGEVYHAGRIGADGAALTQMLRDSGVDVSLVAVDPDGFTGSAFIQVAHTGQNSILVSPNANVQIAPEALDAALAGFGAGDLLILQNETNITSSAISAAKARGMQVCLNAAPMTDAVQEMPLEALDMLIVNETEGAALAGSTDVQTILDILCARCPNAIVVVTLGSDGAWARRGAETVYQPVFAVKAVDTTGAGDTFVGYFCVLIGQGASLKEALRIASAASALGVTKNGAAVSIPTMAQVQEALPNLKEK